MREVTYYECSICKQRYERMSSAVDCEKSHMLEEKLHLVPSSIPCPDCEGKGWYYGNDGVDQRFCDTCGGLGVVIPETTTRVTYKRV